MPTPMRTAGPGDCGVRCGRMERSPKRESGRNGAVSREAPSEEPGREEACDERSGPQDVTSPGAGREGINLQQEVAPQQTERSPRNSPEEVTRDVAQWLEINIQ